jgi:H+/Cl- antiporter ClcA
MSALKILFLYTFIAGFIGLTANLYIAGFLLSTESINSPRIFARYFYRYLIFSLSYMASFLLTPALLKPLSHHFDSISKDSDARVFLLFAMCVPLALLFYYILCKLIVRGDKGKIRGRKEFRKKFGSDL